MKILSHRGYWLATEEKNMQVAFERSFSLGFGTETDVRDLNGELVISHDPATTGAMSFNQFLEIYLRYQGDLPLALNIKADGLQAKLAAALQHYQVSNYFVFDMAIPDMLGYLRQTLTTFTRHSDIETQTVLYEPAAGVWLDGFSQHDWINETVLQQHLDAGKQVCIVSPELHKRPHLDFWQRLLNMSNINHSGVMLCTDYPEQAREFFHGQN